MKRLCPERPLPPYAFLPGVNTHPEKPGGHMHGHKVSVEAIELQSTLSNPDFCYALDLFNHAYYWESHVWWEALWNKVGRKGECADFLKGLIKVAAALVKHKLEQADAAHGHLMRAQELLIPLQNGPLDFPLETLIQELNLCLNGALDLESLRLYQR